MGSYFDLRRIFIFYLFTIAFTYAEVKIQRSNSGGVGNIQDIVTCGGFVLPQSLPPLPHVAGNVGSGTPSVVSYELDYSVIHVNLYTSEGLLKFSTECAPNGYYFIPVYDKGSFFLTIDAPEGWSFNPHRVDFVVNDVERSSCDSDINFRFTGFTVLGHVGGTQRLSCSESVLGFGPSDVNLELIQIISSHTSSGVTDELSVSNVTTNEKGNYHFDSVFPGDYIIRASHSSFSFAEGNNEIAITTRWENTVVEESFLITGYNINGKVESSQEGVSGVLIFLTEEGLERLDEKMKENSIPGCIKPPSNTQILPSSHDAMNALCVATTDSNGIFSLSNIPCGYYKVIPYYQQLLTTFKVSPIDQEVIVNHKSVILDQPFQVKGFSAIGKVMNLQNQPIENVKIYIDGSIVDTSNEKGEFHIDGITSGKYHIKAEKEHIFFNDLIDYFISPSNPTLPDIIVSRYHVCGIVNTGKSEISSGRTILLDGGNNGNTLITTITDNNGLYCFEVSPSNTMYSIQADISIAEKAEGLLLAPAVRQINLIDSPILDADFTQSHITINGIVKCLQIPCNTSPSDPVLSVSLTSVKRPHLSPRIATLNEDDSFFFSDVTPGLYRLNVHKDSWCWELTSFDINVEYHDVDNIQFIQSGYFMHSQLSHDIILNFTLLDDKEQEQQQEIKSFKLNHGSNRFCLAKPGLYQLKPVSCYRFEKENIIFDTANPNVITLNALEYEVSGKLTIDLDKKENMKLPEYINLRVLKLDEESTNTVQTEVKAYKIANDNDKLFIYQYNFWASFNSNITIIPNPNPNPDDFLFYPRKQIIILPNPYPNICPPYISDFVGRLGLLITGNVKPAVSNVEIIAKSIYNNNEIISSINTDENGKYILGPLFDDELFILSAYKDGYHFLQNENTYDFQGYHYGQVEINVYSIDEEENRIPIEGVFLSLSGNQYRHNNITNINGIFLFYDLFPGKYHLRPLLKEYEFKPSYLTVIIEEGKTVKYSFIAYRVAFSVYGYIKSLSNFPARDIPIEGYVNNNDDNDNSISESNSESTTTITSLYEETMSDKNGFYRLRGIFPNKNYTLRIKPTISYNDITSSPISYNLINTKQDNEKNFIIFYQLLNFDLTGIVNISNNNNNDNNEYIIPSRSITVDLRLKSNPNHVLQQQNTILDDINFFEFSSLIPDIYLIRARSTTTHTNAISSNEIEADLRTSHAHVIIPLDIQLNNDSGELASGSLLTLFFAIFGIGIFIYRDELIILISDIASKHGKNKLKASTKTKSARQEKIKRRAANRQE